MTLFGKASPYDMTNAVDPIEPPRTASVFCAYAREDESFLNQLHVHLAMLRRQRKIDVWHDRRIEPGEDWEKEIDKQIETVDVILLLMSPDFLDSDLEKSCRSRFAVTEPVKRESFPSLCARASGKRQSWRVFRRSQRTARQSLVGRTKMKRGLM
jgi:hypothetical protein